MKLVWSKITGFVRNYLIPTFLLGREKALAAFVAPLILGQLARFVPSLHIDPSLIQQLVAAVLISLTVHQTTNTGV